jgi:hypothetical protein
MKSSSRRTCDVHAMLSMGTLARRRLAAELEDVLFVAA